MTLYPSTEQVLAGGKAALDLSVAIANIQVAAMERFSALTFNAAKAMMEGGVDDSLALFAAKDAAGLGKLGDSIAQPSAERTLAYLRSLYDVALQAQTDINRQIEQRSGEWRESVLKDLDKITEVSGSDMASAGIKSALALAGSTYENLNRFSRQASELTEAGFAAAMQGVKQKRTA